MRSYKLYSHPEQGVNAVIVGDHGIYFASTSDINHREMQQQEKR